MATNSKMITKCVFKTKVGNSNIHHISFNELTDGEVIALIRALRIARTISPVAKDLSDYLRRALNVAPCHDRATLDKEQGFMDELNMDVEQMLKEIKS